MIHSTPARNQRSAPGSQLVEDVQAWSNSRDTRSESEAPRREWGKGVNACGMVGLINDPDCVNSLLYSAAVRMNCSRTRTRVMCAVANVERIRQKERWVTKEWAPSSAPDWVSGDDGRREDGSVAAKVYRPVPPRRKPSATEGGHMALLTRRWRQPEQTPRRRD